MMWVSSADVDHHHQRLARATNDLERRFRRMHAFLPHSWFWHDIFFVSRLNAFWLTDWLTDWCVCCVCASHFMFVCSRSAYSQNDENVKLLCNREDVTAMAVRPIHTRLRMCVCVCTSFPKIPAIMRRRIFFFNDLCAPGLIEIQKIDGSLRESYKCISNFACRLCDSELGESSF